MLRVKKSFKKHQSKAAHVSRMLPLQNVVSIFHWVILIFIPATWCSQQFRLFKFKRKKKIQKILFGLFGLYIFSLKKKVGLERWLSS